MFLSNLRKIKHFSYYYILPLAHEPEEGEVGVYVTIFLTVSVVDNPPWAYITFFVVPNATPRS